MHQQTKEYLSYLNHEMSVFRNKLSREVDIFLAASNRGEDPVLRLNNAPLTLFRAVSILTTVYRDNPGMTEEYMGSLKAECMKKEIRRLIGTLQGLFVPIEPCNAAVRDWLTEKFES